MNMLSRLLASLLAAFAVATSASANPVLTLQAHPNRVHALENLYVDVVISGLQSGGTNTLLGAFDLTLTYDPAVLQLLLTGMTTLGGALGDPADPAQTIVGGDISTPGVFRFFEVSLLESSASTCTFCVGPYLEDLQGDSLLLATLAFYDPGTVSTSSTQLGLVQGAAVFADAFGNAMANVDVQNHLTITIPEPAIMLLVPPALLAAIGSSRRRRRDTLGDC